LGTETFCGSYLPGDVEFLLKRVKMEFTDVETKEKAIQSGQRHYSEMLSPEKAPSQRYQDVYQNVLAQNAPRMARDLWTLALQLKSYADKHCPQGLTLVSLARGGTPLGVLLQRVLGGYLQQNSVHYSVSIIRDKGLDANALKHIIYDCGRQPESIVFVDGWTGKGVIQETLETSIQAWNTEHPGKQLKPQMLVLSDLAGTAYWAAHSEDYIIPSCILNATISGLTSRTVLHPKWVGPNDFHACVYLEDLRPYDQTLAFIDTILSQLQELISQDPSPVQNLTQVYSPRIAREQSQAFLEWVAQTYGICDRNRIKPGIGESTRVLLRRVPQILLLQNAENIDVRHLVFLAQEKNVAIAVHPEMPYQAAALIREMESD
jgi:hypothetical protein